MIEAKNPYKVLGEALVSSVTAGNRGKMEGRQEGLSDRLRQYAFYRQETAVEAGDAVLVNDLLDAAKRLKPRRICPSGVPCTSNRCETSGQCLAGDYDIMASGELTPQAALEIAIQHIEHMAAWITDQNAGYSFEGLGEDMPNLRRAVSLTNGERT